MGRRYFRDDNLIGRTLRLLNLLEPDRFVLSISKAFMWLTVAALAFAVLKRPDDVPTIIAAAVATLASTTNYAYRRHTQFKKPPRVDESLPD